MRGRIAEQIQKDPPPRLPQRPRQGPQPSRTLCVWGDETSTGFPCPGHRGLAQPVPGPGGGSHACAPSSAGAAPLWGALQQPAVPTLGAAEAHCWVLPPRAWLPRASSWALLCRAVSVPAPGGGGRACGQNGSVDIASQSPLGMASAAHSGGQRDTVATGAKRCLRRGFRSGPWMRLEGQAGSRSRGCSPDFHSPFHTDGPADG